MFLFDVFCIQYLCRLLAGMSTFVSGQLNLSCARPHPGRGSDSEWPLTVGPDNSRILDDPQPVAVKTEKENGNGP